MCGIYQIRNTANNKVYVGSTQSFVRREQDHFSYLRRGVHPNRHLQSSYIKYGKESFIFEILEECSLDILIEKEQEYINILSSDKRTRGYNMCPVAGTTRRREVTKETREKISKATKGRKGLKGAKNPMYGKSRPLDVKKKISHTLRKKMAGSKTKLNWQVVRLIREEYKTGTISKSELGRRYSVDRSQICRIINNQTWREIGV